MSALSAHEKHFAPLLGMLPPEIGRSLGPWVDKLSEAIGPLRARARTGGGAPDGFEGLTLRGPYERLVLSEWAIADVAPEEFLRRAAQREHPFYQLARRDEARARTSVALFDPGPMQLGGPRVGQFALLLVLAGRASQAGARFGWSMLQRSPDPADPTAGLRSGITEEGLRSFLFGRLATPPAERDLQPWFDRARRDDWEDLWIIGPPDTVAPGRRLPGVKTPVGRVAVSDVFEAGLRSLDVTVARGAHRRLLRLPLPPENDCLRLLRDGALAPKAPPPVRMTRAAGVARPVTAPVLLADGRKVAWLDADRNVTIYTVPDAPSPKRPRYRRYALDEGHLLLGLGWTRRQLVTLTEKDHELHVRDVSGTVFPHDRSRRPGESGPWEDRLRPTSLARVEIVGAGPAPPTALFVDGIGRLVALSATPSPRTVAWAGAVLAMASTLGCVRVVTRLPATGSQPLPHDVVLTHVDATDARVCSSAPVKNAVLQRQPGGEWHVPQHGSIQVVRPRPDAAVLGVVQTQGFTLDLLCLDADHRALVAVDARDSAVLLSLDRPARHASVTPRCDRVALLLDDDSVEVWALPKPVCLLRVEAPA